MLYDNIHFTTEIKNKNKVKNSKKFKLLCCLFEMNIF